MQPSNFLELVAKERTRQIIEKGYTPVHDDEHADGSIADAAACYASPHNQLRRVVHWGNHQILHRVLWPWENEYFKKDDKPRKDQLIIAASLLMAEYERIIRAEQKDSRCRGCNYLSSDEVNVDLWCSLDGMPAYEDDTRCEQYCLPPFEASENNLLLQSFMKSSTQ